MFVVFYFLVVIALPAALGIYVVVNGLPRSRQCPACADETLQLRSRTRRLMSGLLRQDEIQLRWCLTCGWRGTVRLRALAPPSFTATSLSGETGFAASPSDRIDIRSLKVDGRSWTVMVQCWAQDGHWVGRLVFIDAGGRECGEEEISIAGRSAAEVFSTALAIPDRTLVGRLRRAIH